jgi:hypothetical protein
MRGGVLAGSGRFGEVADQQFPLLHHPSRHGDRAARELVRWMADETGPEAFVRQPGRVTEALVAWASGQD